MKTILWHVNSLGFMTAYFSIANGVAYLTQITLADTPTRCTGCYVVSLTIVNAVIVTTVKVAILYQSRKYYIEKLQCSISRRSKTAKIK